MDLAELCSREISAEPVKEPPTEWHEDDLRPLVVRYPSHLAASLATLLVGFPNPPRETAASIAGLTTTDPVLAGLGGRDALSIADALVMVARDESCGLGCFGTSGDFYMAIDRPSCLDRFQSRSDLARGAGAPPDVRRQGRPRTSARSCGGLGLNAGVLTEKLGGSTEGLTIISTYRLRAPDRAEITSSDSTQILAGLDQYRRTGTGPWVNSTFPTPSFSWPTGNYRDVWAAGLAAVRIIDTDTIDGVLSEIIGFVRSLTTSRHGAGTHRKMRERAASSWPLWRGAIVAACLLARTSTEERASLSSDHLRISLNWPPRFA